MSFVATGKDTRQRGAGRAAPRSPDSAPARGREAWRPALVGLARRPGSVAVMLAVGTFVAYAVVQFGLGASARGAGVKHAPPPSPADAQRCWTNDTSATVFLAPWFAPLAPTKGLRSDCSMEAAPSPAGVVGVAIASSPTTSSTTFVAPGAPPPPGVAARSAAAAGNAVVEPPRAPSRVTPRQVRVPWTPPTAKPRERPTDPRRGWPSRPPRKASRDHDQDERRTGGDRPDRS